MTWRRFWSAQTGVFLGISLALMLLGRSSLLQDPGTFWHIRVGQQMLDSAQVVRSDSFSFTRSGQPWIVQWWLAECGMAALYRLAGWDALVLATVTLLACVYTWVAARLIRAGLHLLPVVLVLGLVLMASSHQFHVRPLIFTIALLGLTYALLIDVEAGRARLRRLWWFVPLVVLWTNLHGGVLAGLGSVGLVAAGWCLAWLLGRPSPVGNARDALAMVALIFTSGLAVLVNPYGLDLPRAWINTLTIPLPSLIQEHGRLDLAKPLGWTTVLLGLGYLAVLAGVFPKRPRIAWLLPLVWFVLACQRVRHAPLFAITVAVAFAEVLPHTRWAKWLERREMFLPPGRREPRRRDWRPAAAPLLLVVTAMLLQLAGVRAPIVGRDWAKLDATRWPVELLPEIEQINRTSPEHTRIFNDLHFGGFLIYHAPRLKVFIDDRCALYGTEFLQQYDRARRKDPAQIDRWQQQYGFRYALVAAGTPLDDYLKDADGWTVVRPASEEAGQRPVASLYRQD